MFITTRLPTSIPSRRKNLSCSTQKHLLIFLIFLVCEAAAERGGSNPRSIECREVFFCIDELCPREDLDGVGDVKRRCCVKLRCLCGMVLRGPIEVTGDRFWHSDAVVDSQRRRILSQVCAFLTYPQRRNGSGRSRDHFAGIVRAGAKGGRLHG